MLPKGWVDELAGPSGLVTDGDWVESKDQDQSGTVRLTQLADVGVGEFRDRSARFMTSEAVKRLNCTYLLRGDVLIARMPDPIGRACIFPGLDQPAVTAVDVMLWRTDRCLASEHWFVRWINSPVVRAAMTAGAGGTTRQRISGGQIKKLRLPLPPLAEQRRIVAKLDALTARLARARAELERVPVLSARLRRTVLSDVYSSKSTSVMLSNLLKNIQAGKNLQCEERIPLDHESGVVKVSAVSSERFRASEAKTLPSTYFASEKDRILEGDLLLARASGSLNMVGRVTLVDADPGNLYLSDKVLRLDFDASMKLWAYWFLRSPHGRDQIESAATGISMHNITQSSLRSLRLPVPPLQEQTSRLRQIQSTFARADRLEAEAARATKLLDRLEAAILAKAFRGELVPQDPADEPAAVLLDRIRAERAAAPKPKRGRRAQAARAEP